ncbi:hypothetical protein NIES2130_36635 [Scytonema sp. HK-05]|nr:hypothetical protein NIES2130_36635 [Scytonema sp. HK-05]
MPTLAVYVINFDWFVVGALAFSKLRTRIPDYKQEYDTYERHPTWLEFFLNHVDFDNQLNAGKTNEHIPNHTSRSVYPQKVFATYP